MIETKGQFDIVLPDREVDVDISDYASIIGEGRDLIERGTHHYTINSGQAMSPGGAIKAFWACLDSHKPIPDGGIHWRLPPTMRTYKKDGDLFYQLIARFSIA
jgi:hypothetical protein